MDVKHVNPFIDAFTTVMPQLGFGNIQKGELSIKNEELTYSGIIVIVGIVGAVKGNVAYCMDMEGAKTIASTMMMGMPIDELDDMSRSALAELTNMLTANAATNFSDLGIPIDISTPTLLYGENISAKMSSNEVLCIQFFVEEHPIEISIAFQQ